MHIHLWKRPKNSRIIVGYPGFGLVGTIATGFLVDHLQCERIGTGYLPEMPATVALHDGKLTHPIDVHYSKKHNLIFINAIAGMNTLEWKAADILLDLGKKLQCKEMITIEGVASQTPGVKTSSGKAHYYCNKPNKKLDAAGAQLMKDGLIMGLSSALMIKNASLLTCLFVETQINLPDSKGAAKMIEVLDKYLGLDVDYKPLLKQAADFETKLKTLLEQKKQVESVKEKHSTDYIS